MNADKECPVGDAVETAAENRTGKRRQARTHASAIPVSPESPTQKLSSAPFFRKRCPADSRRAVVFNDYCRIGSAAGSVDALMPA